MLFFGGGGGKFWIKLDIVNGGLIWKVALNYRLHS